MEEARPALEQQITAALSLFFVLGSGVYTALSRPFSPIGLTLLFASSATLLVLCRKPIKKASAATGIIGVGAVVYALPPGMIASSPTFGAGLMAIGLVIAISNL